MLRKENSVPVFIIAQINIHDRNAYAKYEEGFGAIFARYEGTLVSVDEDVEVLEGDWSFTRTVVLQFPSAGEARRWFDSDEYQALAEHRKAASVGNVALVKHLQDSG